MSEAIERVPVTTTLDSALARLREKELDALAVIDGGAIVGTVALVAVPSRHARLARMP